MTSSGEQGAREQGAGEQRGSMGAGSRGAGGRGAEREPGSTWSCKTSNYPDKYQTSMTSSGEQGAGSRKQYSHLCHNA